MNDVIRRLAGLNRPFKRAIQMLSDSILIVICFAGAMALRLESFSFALNLQVWVAVLPVIPLTILVFAKLGLYRAIIRYITGDAMRAVLIGTLASALALLATAQLLSAPVPRSVPGIFALLLLLATGGSRFLMRALFRKPAVQNRVPVLVYGAGEAGRQLLNALHHGREYQPVAFVDDEPTIQQTLVAGKPVIASSQIARVVKEMPVHSILLAIPSASRARRREIIAQLEPLGIEIKTIPGMDDIIEGRAQFSDLRRVTPEDLLGRDPVPPSPELMGRNITGKVVLVSGAGGSIGSELCRQIIKHAPEALILLEISEFALYSISLELREALARSQRSLRIEPVLGSVQHPDRVRAILRAYGVETIYHAAAYKHVVLVEENVVEGIQNNIFGTQVIAKAAAELGVENFILISTDKAVRPTSFMGASKRMAELVCQALAKNSSRTTFSMVRFGNVLGSSGSVIPRFRAQIERGGPVTVTHREITRYFMTISEASQLVIQAGAMARNGDVFVLDMGEPVKIFDLAQTMIQLHGLKPYVLDGTGRPEPARGDIPIQIVGLNKGEKLYEELLIGENPRGTEHPRIMTATEVSLTSERLQPYLDQLTRACRAFDIVEIRDLFLEAPLAFQPNGRGIHDLVWNAAGVSESETTLPRLKAVKARE